MIAITHKSYELGPDMKIKTRRERSFIEKSFDSRRRAASKEDSRIKGSIEQCHGTRIILAIPPLTVPLFGGR
jgi:hypothetical protein